MAFSQKLTKRQVFLDKIEAVAGENAYPVPEADACLALSGATITAEGEVIANDRLSSTMSLEAHQIGKVSSKLERRVELRGGGITGSAVSMPDYDALLQSCAMARTDIESLAIGVVTGAFERGEVVTGGTSAATATVIAELPGTLLIEAITGTFDAAEVLTGGTSAATVSTTAIAVTGYQYMPMSDPDAMKTMTSIYYMDGHKHVLTGCRADFSMSIPVGQPGTLTFNQQGRFAIPVEEAMPTPTLNTALPPLAVEMGLKVGGYSPMGVNEMTLAMANKMTKDEDMNAVDGLAGYYISGRQPVGTLNPKSDSLDNFNPWQEWKTGNMAMLSCVIGAAAGNRVYIEAPKIQYTTPAYADREGVMGSTLNFELKKDVAGDDELRLIYF